MSEVDSLSDSDWLDISSSKESDDNDSVSSRATDHDEVDYGPPSRRSSISVGSSRDGDVEAWEGFAEDSADELVPHDDLIGLSIPPTLPPALRNPAIPLDESLIVSRDVVIEQDDNAVLDQSTTGTLSASRSSSAGHASTAQNSTQDLKLSFPDPLTSSRDELNTTYGDASPSETTSEGDVVPVTTRVDPGPSTTPEVLTILISKDHHPAIKPDLEIVLYGISVAARWSVVDSLLKKAAVGAGLTLTSSEISVERSRGLQINGHREAITSFPKVVTVIDRTSDRFSYYPVGLDPILSINSPTITRRPEKRRFQGVHPSLAIILLPSMSCASVRHTSYLPVFVPSDNASASSIDNDKRRQAAKGWSEGSIGPDALFSVMPDAASILDINEVANLEASRVHNALGRLMIRANDAKRRRAESLKEAQTARDSQFFRSAVTGYEIPIFVNFGDANLILFRGLIAMVAILLVRLCLPAKEVPTRVLTPSITNKSNPVASNGAAVIPSSLKDFALAVFNPVHLSATPAISLAKQGRSTGSASTDTKTKEPDGGDGKLMTWSERVKSSKELCASSLSFEARSKKALSLIVPQHAIAQTEEPPSALSIRLADSLSQIFNVKALSEVVQHDMKELSDAMDQLMIAIGKQKVSILGESKGTSKILRERLEQRHGKAKARARRLKDMGGQLGGQLLSYVGGEIKSRADLAKGRAREMAETFVQSEAWTVHRKRMQEHGKRLEASRIERANLRREARRARRQARRGKHDCKKRCGIFSRT